MEIVRNTVKELMETTLKEEIRIFMENHEGQRNE